MGNPATIRATPTTRAIGNSGGAKCQCVKYQGTYTASVPGAMTRKIAEPMIAAARCTPGAYSTPPARLLSACSGHRRSPAVRGRIGVQGRVVGQDELAIYSL